MKVHAKLMIIEAIILFLAMIGFYFLGILEANNILFMSLFTGFLFLAFWAGVRIFVTKSLNQIFENINLTASDVMAVSNQMASAGHTFNAKASDQAASIEDASSSLEKIAALITQTTEHTTYARKIMKDAIKASEQADESMKKLTIAMQAISHSSEEISKINKTINEIAFQTNLLALNASVEAARAGEAGAGFAVVADEVRNLALRSAAAVQNTESLIANTVEKIKGGSALVETAYQAYKELISTAATTAKIVKEIHKTSEEQKDSIDQAHTAFAAINQAAQKNATHTEESRSFSEQLKAKTQSFKKSIQELAL
jgi:methyl-accepting chemotaxis protein